MSFESPTPSLTSRGDATPPSSPSCPSSWSTLEDPWWTRARRISSWDAFSPSCWKARSTCCWLYPSFSINAMISSTLLDVEFDVECDVDDGVAFASNSLCWGIPWGACCTQFSTWTGFVLPSTSSKLLERVESLSSVLEVAVSFVDIAPFCDILFSDIYNVVSLRDDVSMEIRDCARTMFSSVPRKLSRSPGSLSMTAPDSSSNRGMRVSSMSSACGEYLSVTLFSEHRDRMYS